MSWGVPQDTWQSFSLRNTRIQFVFEHLGGTTLTAMSWPHITISLPNWNYTVPTSFTPGHERNDHKCIVGFPFMSTKWRTSVNMCNDLFFKVSPRKIPLHSSQNQKYISFKELPPFSTLFLNLQIPVPLVSFWWLGTLGISDLKVFCVCIHPALYIRHYLC